MTLCHHHKAEEGCPVCQHERERYDRIADAMTLSALLEARNQGWDLMDPQIDALICKLASRPTSPEVKP